MTRRPSIGRPWVYAALIVGAAFLLGGCLAYHVVSAPVKVAATTVVVAGEATGAAVKTTGRVATSAITAAGKLGGSGIDAAGNVGSTSIDAAARLAQAGMVTFVDASTGTVTRVPWRHGLTLASAGAEARVLLARRAIDVLRAGNVIFSARKLAGEGAALAAGDVVRVRG